MPCKRGDWATYGDEIDAMKADLDESGEADGDGYPYADSIKGHNELGSVA